MTRILVAESRDSTLARTLAAAGMNVGRTEVTHLTRLAGTPAGPPDVLVADLRGLAGIPSELRLLRQKHPRVGVIAVTATLDPGVLLGAMRAGVSEVVADPGLTEHLIAAVSRVASTQLLAAAGRVFAFVGAKGGVGTTTVAVNVATALGVARNRTLLVDLHDGDGDAATFVNLTPTRTLADACANAHRLDDRYLRGLVSPIGTHVDLLAAPEIRSSAAVEGARFQTVMQRAAASYQYVIVDVSAAQVPLLTSLEALTGIIVVATQEFVSLKRGRQLAEGLKSWCRHDRVSAVVNRFDPHVEISQRDVERALGVDITQTVPNEYALATAAIERGRPVVFDEPNGLQSALTALAGRLGGDGGSRDARAIGRPGLLHRLAHVS